MTLDGAGDGVNRVKAATAPSVTLRRKVKSVLNAPRSESQERPIDTKASPRPPRRTGRPVEKPTPDPILDNPENIAFALVNTPPKTEDEWDYLKENKG